MIDALFGSKTRVKLLHLFLNNPGQPFYVREITRKIEEQINSVRRELSNMLEVGIITSDSSENKLYYEVNQRYDYYVPLRTIFGDVSAETKNILPAVVSDPDPNREYGTLAKAISGLRLVIFSGILVHDSSTSIDILFVGNALPIKIKALVKHIEKSEGRDINYTMLSYDDFYYRLSVRDKFITEILNSKHSIIVDRDKVLDKE
jgi:predicted transcriptional regulator